MLSLRAGSYVPVKVTPSDREGLSSLQQEVKLQLPTGLRQGSVQVEVARGGFISQAQVPALLCFTSCSEICPAS